MIDLIGSGSWTARTDAEWISLKRKDGTESQKPTFVVLHNYSTEKRTGVIYVNECPYEIAQLGYEAVLHEKQKTIPAEGGKFEVLFDVEKAIDGSETPIVWSAKSECDWVAFPVTNSTASAGGTGVSVVTVMFSANKNNGLEARNTNLKIAGQILALTQEGASQPGDDEDDAIASLTPNEMTVGCSGTITSVCVKAISALTTCEVPRVRPQWWRYRGSDPNGGVAVVELEVPRVRPQWWSSSGGAEVGNMV